MTDYADYLRTLDAVANGQRRAAEATRRYEERHQSNLDEAGREAEAARARHGRLREEVTRQLDTARSALADIGRAGLLAGARPPITVDQATEADVTSAVQTLQVAVGELVQSANQHRDGRLTPGGPSAKRGTVVLVSVLAVLLALAVVAFMVGLR